MLDGLARNVNIDGQEYWWSDNLEASTVTLAAAAVGMTKPL